MKKQIGIILFLIIIFSTSLTVVAADFNRSQPEGWWLPSTGSFSGHWDLGVGAHFWNDHFDLRNLQLRTNVDLAPGLRINSILRSNDDFNSIDDFDPNFDELYLEAYAFHNSSLGKLSLSLKTGRMRYLRFPEPDLISYFDAVPGTEDLRFDDAETGYRGQLLSLDFKSKLGLGYHASGINWDYGDRDGSNWIESYVYYKDRWQALDFEARAGKLALRHAAGEYRGSGSHLGDSGDGYNIYLGGNWNGYKAGLLYEEIENEKYNETDRRTGIVVEFAFSEITELLGKLRFDYTRSPEGFAAHIPIAAGDFGYLAKKPTDKELVGEIKAERIMTYWQNGQARNFYEHRISKWGITDASKTVVYMEVEPWHLQVEALVSPHSLPTNWDEAKEWESSRQGPAQLKQPVTYKFYRAPCAPSGNGTNIYQK